MEEQKETKLVLLEGLTVSDHVKELVSKAGIKGLAEVARLQRTIALKAVWTVKERPDKSFQEIAAHNGRRVSMLLSDMFTKLAKQAREVGNYIEAVRMALQGHGDIESNLTVAGAHQVELDEQRANDEERPSRKKDVTTREKLQQTPEMALYRKVVIMWAEAGCPRGLPQEAIDEIAKWVKAQAKS